jgi:ABC-type Co2+ transport system permease subunit
VPDLGSRARVAVIIAVAAAAFTHLGEPIYYHHDWGHFIYLFIADSLALAAAGVIIAWFLPKARAAAPADAPTDV